MKSWTDRAVKIFAKEVQNGTVKTDETPDSGLSSVSSVQNQELIEDFLRQKINFSDQDGTKSYSDLWCYPNSSAMNTDEIAIFQARVSRNKSCGLDVEKSEALADKLLIRDREKGADDSTPSLSELGLAVLCDRTSSTGVENRWRRSVPHLIRRPFWRPRPPLRRSERPSS